MADKRDRDRREMADTDEWLGGQASSGGWLCLKYPGKANRFQPKEAKTYLLDIGPYKATTAHPNAGVHRRFVPDVMFQVHRMVGPNKDNILCPGRTYRRKCFVCEYRAKMGAGPDRDADVQKALKELQPKDRQLWNVFNHDEKEKGWQIFEYSFFLFGQNIAQKIQMSRANDRERYKKFWHPGSAGMSLKCLGIEDSGPGGSKFINFSQIEFVERDNKTLARLEKAGDPWVLDPCIRETPYEEVKQMFLSVGGGDDDEDGDEEDSDLEDDTTDEEDDDEVEDDEDGDEGDEDGDEEEEDDDEEEDEEDEDEVTPPPAFKGDRVKFKDGDGDKYEGKVLAVLADAGKLKIKTSDGTVYRVAYAKVTPLKKKRTFPD